VGCGYYSLAIRDEKTLDNLTVIEYAEMMSGQICGKMFSDMGAEVIKIEAPHRGGPSSASFAVSQRRTASRKERSVPPPQYRREGLLYGRVRLLHFARCPPKCTGGRMFTGAVGSWCQTGAENHLSGAKMWSYVAPEKRAGKVTCGKGRGSSSSTLPSSWTNDHVDSDEPAFKHAAISSGVRRKSSCAGPSKTRV
jgi:CoA-transferase family III